ncbi:Leucine-rich repeat neuronal protein 2 [Amphibalanus amphitrite]|uniref:Leucine-rich repeat neuronal protein 2 n=1 Tax=Amphibalanus amphitrite TaxID=1232801 RepID=A0A6A4WKR4_AMPAM|nr:Leucine-rich repeat neuronal protein 2 [Amphibalanus amphitrite]
MAARWLVAAALCLALALPTGAFWSTVCGGCTCSTDTPVMTIDCSDHDFTSAYTSSDTWPTNQTDIHLIYDKNSLTEVAKVPAQNITELSFQHNDIASIADGAFVALPRLKRLDLSHNKLVRDSLTEKTFRGQFSADDYQPSPIQQLDLSYNNIHSIYEEVLSHFSSLLELDLSYNSLSLLDHHTQMAITSLPRLRTLQLAGTGLKEMPHGLLHSLITLRHLNLADNQLTEVPPELHNSHAIETLTLNKNPIKDINEDSFRGMVNLRVLNIAYMPNLEYISDNSFSTLVALRVLRCRNNERLWSVSPHIFDGMDTSPGIFPLQELFLSGNNLTTLAAETVPFWDQLLQVQLHDNPWRCDCRLQWMVDLLPKLVEKGQTEAERVTCRLPENLAGVPVLGAAKSSEGPLPCTPELHHTYIHNGSSTTLAAALTIGGVLGAVLILLVCVFFFWFVVAAAHSGAVPPADRLLLRMVGSFVLFLLITTGATVFVIRRETTAARCRAKQQIRYRRAAMEEEAGMEDTAQVVST